MFNLIFRCGCHRVSLHDIRLDRGFLGKQGLCGVSPCLLCQFLAFHQGCAVKCAYYDGMLCFWQVLEPYTGRWSHRWRHYPREFRQIRFRTYFADGKPELWDGWPGWRANAQLDHGGTAPNNRWERVWKWGVHGWGPGCDRRTDHLLQTWWLGRSQDWYLWGTIRHRWP